MKRFYGERGSETKHWVFVLITSGLDEYYQEKIEPQFGSIPVDTLSRRMRDMLIDRGSLWEELPDLLDKTILFKRLDERSLLTLGVKHLREMSEAYGLNLAGVTPEALAHMVRVSKDSRWGARTLLGYIYSVILEKLLLFREERLWIDVDQGQLILRSRGRLLEPPESL